ncbi:MAG: response regulator, partial [Deltaproteobacteria bacterium]|nr:response regulator [Deltaproteobacteria bacterium]
KFGHERVLFIDDEDAMVEMGVTFLEKLGYRVTSRTSSREALILFKIKPYDFDVIITDQTMPQMTGDHLAQEILKIRPEIPIILCTGYSREITPEEAKKLGIREFVYKPLVFDDFSEKLRNVLDQTKSMQSH